MREARPYRSKNYLMSLSANASESTRQLAERWQRLCERYLPLADENSIWRLSGSPKSNSPEQGWKLHVSATILTACSVLERVAPYLARESIQFKAPISLEEVQRLNSGLDYNYTQIGKLITVYPDSVEEAKRIARRLHSLTSDLRAPTIPFDEPVRPDSCVYYRYGAFRSLEIENHDGTKTPALREPSGKLVPDSRRELKPVWVKETLFPSECFETSSTFDNPLKSRYRVVNAVTQRGEGGVYQAIDMTAVLPRPCIIKEGRYLGEVSWDGRDGVDRVCHEEMVLNALRTAGVSVPEVLASFKIRQNHYLVTEYVQGETLMSILMKRKRRFSLRRSLQLASDVARLVAQIHAAGWTWRDCKPANIIQNDGQLRPVDFEGACMNKRPDALPWGTRGFTPPSWQAHVTSRQFEDLYALGATLYFFLTGRLRENESSPPISRLRRNVPESICRVVNELLSAGPGYQPTAASVSKHLHRIANDLSPAR